MYNGVQTFEFADEIQDIECYNSTHCYTAQIWSKNVYPTIDVNFSILTRECKNKKLVDNIFSSNFVLLSMC